ncbi:hypothetical protein DMA15_25940 [Streptomyces sp. WAC 01529]|nr:hypothetical protein DMA15_25940 [Streptomyces sp. WAC 01529]
MGGLRGAAGVLVRGAVGGCGSAGSPWPLAQFPAPLTGRGSCPEGARGTARPAPTGPGKPHDPPSSVRAA